MGSCHATMKQKRSIENPFKSVHAAALVNFGEAVGGMAVLTAIESSTVHSFLIIKVNYKIPMQGIVVKLSTEYYKKARGVLSAKCDLDFFKTGAGQSIVPEGTRDIVVPILNSAGEEVAKVNATWKFSKSEKKKLK